MKSCIEWRSVVGFEGLYEVSSTGLVRSIDRVVKNGYSTTRVAKGVILKAGKKSNGYLQVCLGRTKNRYVHRLVAEAFVQNPLNRNEIDHIDGDRANNNSNNLRWVTRSENNLNPIWRNKRQIPILQIEPNTNKIVAEHKSISDASMAIGCHEGYLSRVISLGRKYKNYKWIKKSNYDKDKINIPQSC